MTSTRFAPGVAIVLALAMIPTLRHSYIDQRDDDGRISGAVSQSLAGLHGESTSRPATWGTELFDSHDWIERRYLGADGREVVLAVIRSYDLKRLYHHPELGAAYGRDLHGAGIARLPSMPEIPLHILRPLAEQRPGLAAYALHYDNEFVENPYIFQLRAAWKLIVTNRKPMTLFFVYDPTFPSTGAVERAPGVAVLIGAVQSFLAQSSKVAGARARWVSAPHL